MPYVPEEEEKTDEVGQTPQESGDISVSGQSSSTVQATTPSSQNQAQKGSIAGQRLGNLKRMVEANQNPQIASKIGENLGQKEKALETQLVGEDKQSGLVGQFRTQTDQEKARLAAANPLSQQFTQWTPEQINQFQSGQMVFDPQTQQLRAAGEGGVGYQGFQQAQSGQANTYDIQELGDIRRQAEALRTQAEQGETQAGRFNLLRDVFAKDKRYTSGQQKVDELLLQQKGIDQLRGLAKTTGQSLVGEQGYIPQTQAEIEAARQAITGQAADVAGNIQTGTTGQFQNIKDSILNKYQTQEQNRLGLVNRINQAIADNNLSALSPEDLKTLGIDDIVSPLQTDTEATRGIQGRQFEGTEAEIQKAQEDIIKRGLVTGLPGVELEKYFRDLNQETPITEQQAISRFANPEEIAKVQALENLTNIKAQFDYNPELAGKGFGDYAPDVLKQTLQTDTTGVVSQKINELRDPRPTDTGATFGQYWGAGLPNENHAAQLTRTMTPQYNNPADNKALATYFDYVDKLNRWQLNYNDESPTPKPVPTPEQEKGSKIMGEIDKHAGGYFDGGNALDRIMHESAKRAEVQARNQKLLKDLYGWMQTDK